MDSDLLVCAGIVALCCPLASVSSFCLCRTLQASLQGCHAHGLLPALHLSAIAAARLLCIMEQNVSKATYSAFATRGWHIAPGKAGSQHGQTEVTVSVLRGQAKVVLLHMAQLVCLQNCLPLWHTQLSGN